MSGAGRSRAWDAASGVADPELPFLTVADLGILRRVEVGTAGGGGSATAVVTPTYSGCPAMTEIKRDIAAALAAAGFAPVEVRTELAPPWTTDWITDEGRAKLAGAGIAPPVPPGDRESPAAVAFLARAPRVTCPHCGSTATDERSRFGATACKALYACRECREPFEYVKAV